MQNPRLTAETTGRDVFERRQWTRYTSDVTVVTLIVDGVEQDGIVVDESFGGLGILLMGPFSAHAGREIDVLYEGAPMRGTIRRVLPEGDGRCRVGVEWLRAARGESSANRKSMSSEATYVSFRGFDLVCHVLESLTDGLMRVRLPDGSHRTVERNRLSHSTKAQRLESLEQLEDGVNMLLGAYQLGKRKSRAEALGAILDFEFASSWE